MAHSLRHPLSERHIARPSNEVRVVRVYKADFFVGLHSMQGQVHHSTAIAAAQKILEQKAAPGLHKAAIVQVTTLFDVDVSHNVITFDQSPAELREQRSDVTPSIGRLLYLDNAALVVGEDCSHLIGGALISHAKKQIWLRPVSIEPG